MILIGLTGSIGSGKSTVTRQFASLGAATLDSDLVVHRLLERGGEAVAPVARLFPEVRLDGGIDRRKLGGEVFGHPDKLKSLEAIIHPLVRKAQENFVRRARREGRAFVVLDIPLLFETQGDRRCDVTVVTTAPFFVQKSRVLRRPNMTEEKFLRILAAQMPDNEKRRRADYVVPTGAGLSVSLKKAKQIIAHLSLRRECERIAP